MSGGANRSCKAEGNWTDKLAQRWHRPRLETAPGHAGDPDRRVVDS